MGVWSAIPPKQNFEAKVLNFGHIILSFSFKFKF